MRLNITKMSTAVRAGYLLVIGLCFIFLLHRYSADPVITDLKSNSVAARPVQSALEALLPTRTYIYSCDDNPARNVSYPSHYMKHWTEYHDFLASINADIMIGTTSRKGREGIYNFYHIMAQQQWVRTVCETGVNAGHSAFQWLSSSSSINFYGFDLCNHQYTTRVSKYLNTTFPGRMHLTCGDSQDTLPRMSTLFGKCDIVVVDGGHSYEIALIDLLNFKQHANVNNHLLIIDDIPGIDGVSKAWEEVKLKNAAKEIFICKPPTVPFGFVVGYYNM